MSANYSLFRPALSSVLNSWFLRTATGVACALVPVVGCDCDVTDFNPVAPQIAVDVCASPVKEANGKVIGGTDDCALDFGNADLAVRVEKFFTITNPSSLELNIKDKDSNPGISFAAVGDEGFEFINEPPTSIGPGLSAQIGVAIRPALEAALVREIVILSDANNVQPNDDDLAEIHIPITLTGVDNGVPDIAPDGTLGVAWRCKKARNLEPRDLVLRFDGATQSYSDEQTAGTSSVSDFDAFAPRAGS